MDIFHVYDYEPLKFHFQIINERKREFTTTNFPQGSISSPYFRSFSWQMKYKNCFYHKSSQNVLGAKNQ